jgi:hypothetical protein
MDYINISSTYKASGKQYEKIVFWNRFLRNKTELILTFLPGIAGIIAFAAGYRTTFLMILYCIFLLYPVISYRQFKSAVKYHLEHRAASEGAHCDFTLNNLGILCEIDGIEEKITFKWVDFTAVYDKLNFYMFFIKNDMQVMINQNDIPDELKAPVNEYIYNHIDHNKCIIK